MRLRVYWFGVRLETFGKLLRDHGSCLDVFRMWEEAGSPELIAIFKGFVREVISFTIEVQFGTGTRRILFVVSILHEDWEGANLASINLMVIFLLGFLFFLELVQAANATAGRQQVILTLPMWKSISRLCQQSQVIPRIMLC